VLLLSARGSLTAHVAARPAAWNYGTGSRTSESRTIQAI